MNNCLFQSDASTTKISPLQPLLGILIGELGLQQVSVLARDGVQQLRELLLLQLPAHRPLLLELHAQALSDALQPAALPLPAENAKIATKL